MMTKADLDLSGDIIDVRDIIARVEELEETGAQKSHEFSTLASILVDLNGMGGDEQWRGDWYPITLIRDSFFADYARELLEECGELPRKIPHYIEIDWQATARNIRVDYSSIEINGATYWTR
jgi:hypothetical protein